MRVVLHKNTTKQRWAVGLSAALLVFGLVANSVNTNVNAASEALTAATDKQVEKSVELSIKDLQVEGTGNDSVFISLFVPNGTMTVVATGSVAAAQGSSLHGNSIKFNGLRLDVNATLKTLTYRNATPGEYKITAQLGEGGVYNPDNSHVYQVVPADPDDPQAGITWDEARIAAAGKTYAGVSGYLATITDEAEYNFIMQRISGDGWIGASDAAQEGDWRWVTGPEGLEDGGKGLAFWSGDGTGSVVPGQFAMWGVSSQAGGTNEPNNSGANGEDCAQIRMTTGGKWNDLWCDTELPFYIIEYGTSAELPHVPTTSFDVTVFDPEALPDVPNGGDGNNDGVPDAEQDNVHSLPAADGEYVTVQVDDSCSLSDVSTANASTFSTKDAGFNYNNEFVNFTASGCTGGKTAVKVFYHGVNKTDVTVRKYTPATGGYFTINDATVTPLTGELTGVVVLYDIVDNGLLDDDPAVGVITDPVGIGVAAIGAPNTGFGRK